MPPLDTLGLKDNPFKNTTEPRFFYADASRTQLIESTEHLIEFSNNLQVILAETGVGKTHLLETLTNRLDNNWRVAKISDARQHDTLSLIQAILHAFGAPPESSSDVLETLETQLAEIIQLGFKPVLFIDNAEDISLDALRFLLQLAQQAQDDEAYIHIVLFATANITENLQNSALRDYRDIIHITNLNSFDKEGVAGYLRHKMAVVGFDRESPFTPRIIESIFRDSAGVAEKINFFANKFLASSGKAENYIAQTSAQDSLQNVDNNLVSSDQFDVDDFAIGNMDSEKNSEFYDEFDNQLNEMLSEQENNTELGFDDEDLEEISINDAHHSNLAEEQINRLAEQFDEIEQLGEAPRDSFLRTTEDENYKEPIHKYDENSQKKGLAKFIIPAAVVGLVLAAVLVFNNIFDDSTSMDKQQASNQEIELLPLELPAEKPLQQDKKGLQQEKPVVSSQQALVQSNSNQESNQASIATLELVEVDDNSPVVNMSEDTSEKKVLVNETVEISPSLTLPELKAVEPEPVIGSNTRQYISIVGKNLDKEVSLVVLWAGNNKEFSAKKTPKQWQYIDRTKVKLHLATGITSRQWQVYAKNNEGKQSSAITFEVVKPFVPKQGIKQISPSPVIGSNKRQSITIMGQGFTKQSVVELQWGNNKKQFSSRLTPSQFEFVSSQKINLFITTGLRKRQWKVLLVTATGDIISTSSFQVIPQAELKKQSSADDSMLKDQRWIQQQVNNHYTLQLLSTKNKQAIKDLVSKYSLQGDMAVFEVQRNGQSWYSVIYGNYPSKQAANMGIAGLHSDLLSPPPWVRNFSSIKKQLNLSSQSSLSTDILQSQQAKTKNEAWIWTQNPADYSVQLLALSSEKKIKDYINKYKLNSEAVYFKINRDSKALYVLIYGAYENKKSAVQVQQQLAQQITKIKPLIRSFSEIHGMMSK